MAEHVHEWEETEVHCEDCGDHPGLRCVAEDGCPDDYDIQPIDLVRQEDPREEPGD